MSAKVRIFDATLGLTAAVDEDRNLRVSDANVPGKSDGDVQPTVFRSFLTNNGSSDMRVNGSVTPVTFSLSALQDRDLYITQLVFTVSDAGMTLNEFGNLSALANGCVLQYQQDTGPVVIANSLTTNFELVRLCATSRAFVQNATTAFIMANVSGTSEGMVLNLDFREVFGLKWGLLLSHETNQSLSLTVRDDLTTLDKFDVLAYGFTRPHD